MGDFVFIATRRALRRGRPSVSGIVQRERPASSHVGLRPRAPHRVAPFEQYPPPRASPLTISS